MSKNSITQPAHSLLYNPLDLKTSIFVNADVDLILADVQRYTENDFNREQKQAIESSFKERVFLLWGPPGTGKTATLAGILLCWVEYCRVNSFYCSIAVGSSNWTAIDNLLKTFFKYKSKRSNDLRFKWIKNCINISRI